MTDTALNDSLESLCGWAHQMAESEWPTPKLGEAHRRALRKLIEATTKFISSPNHQLFTCTAEAMLAYRQAFREAERQSALIARSNAKR